MSLSKLLLRLSQCGSDVSNSFQIKLFNGISDIGGLDFYASEQLIVQNVGYGEFSEYFDISTQTDEIVVKESGTNNNIGSYGVEIAQRTGTVWYSIRLRLLQQRAAFCAI